MDNSSNKLPYWLEDLTNSHTFFARSLSKPRPQSWKPLSQNDGSSVINQERRAITTPGRVDVTPVKKALLGLQLDDVGNVTPRGGSARYGRRAVASSQNNDSSTTVTPRECSPIDDLLDPWVDEILPIFREKKVKNSEMPNDRHNKKTNTDVAPIDKSLEESWSSLSLFNRKHRGRLSRKTEEESFWSLFGDDDVICAGDNHGSSTSLKSEFIIPELPVGQYLEVDITATWGDRHYLGLNGLEIFSSTGEVVQVAEITAEPSDINILPEYHKDPRVVTNLLDGVYRTRDDMHLWLAPFTEGGHHFVKVKFVEKETIAMIRIWNYNKSRIHSYRGAKDIHITLDGELIFQGEIARACGGVVGRTDAFGDTILFTMDEDILEKVAQNDDSFNSVMNEGSSEAPNLRTERPLTASIGDIRPLTCAGSRLGSSKSYETTGSVLCTEKITLHLVENWGHRQLIGLTSIQVLGETGNPVIIAEILCNGGSVDQYALNRLLDGTNETTDSLHMWTADLTKGNSLTLQLMFSAPVHITAIIVWNYNSSLEMSYCGVKQLILKLDNHPLPLDNGMITLRRAPGHCHYHFGQLIPLLPNRNESSLSVRINSVLAAMTPRSLYEEEYESPEMPRGFVYQLLLLSTWGDPYYVGLNAIQMYDSQGNLIYLNETNISAHPFSINILDDIDNDVRTPDKLIDGINDTTDGRHMWLAPILPGEINRVYILFNTPVAVSMVKLWNYGKTPSRGVKEFGILVDDLLVYNGVLDTVSNQGCRRVPYRTVIFASNSELAKRERSTQILQQDVELSIFEEHRARSSCSVDQSQRPLTSIRPPSSSLLDS
uniref:KATNIP domain-containing protein n=1 Tax=Clastoptera arizonana TaxID=38151 RepID=A0A1B6E268_9HEMI